MAFTSHDVLATKSKPDGRVGHIVKAMKGWFKVSENILGDPKLLQCSGPAQLAFIYGLAYCARQRTDGMIGEHALPQICQGFPAADVTTIAKTLVGFGLWEIHPKGYRVRNYLDWQRSRKEINTDLASNAARQKRHRLKLLGQAPARLAGHSLAARVRRNRPPTPDRNASDDA